MTIQYDTPDNGTPGITAAQAAALYAFVRKHLTPQLIEAAQNVHHLTYGLQMWMQTTNGDIVDMAALLSEIDSAHDGGNAGGGKRYEVRDNKHPFESERGYMVWDNLINDWYVQNSHIGQSFTIYTFEHEAQVAAQNLNAQESE
jgi:hypothetical protein